jgi:hypothetical protein
MAALTRSEGLCDACGDERIPGLVHTHRRSTGRSQIDAGVENVLALCRECHLEIHAEPSHAFELGFNAPVYIAPAAVPIYWHFSEWRVPAGGSWVPWVTVPGAPGEGAP